MNIEPISHYEWYKNYLIDMFTFDFLKELKKLDEKWPDPNGLNISEKNIEMFIEKSTAKEYLNYLNYLKKIMYNILETFETYMFYKYVKKIFKFEKSLTEMLLRTDLSNVDASFIKPPFNSFYLSIPENTFLCSIPNSDIEYDVAGVYIYNLDINKYDKMTTIRELGRDIILNLQLSVILIPKNSSNTLNWDKEMKVVLNLRFKTGNVFEQLEDNYNRASIEFRKLADELFSFILNSILYINMDKAILKSMQGEYKETRLRLNKRNSGIPPKKEVETKKYSYYHLGNNIIIDTKFKEILYSEEGRSRRKYARKWLVRRHWRNQACGKNMSEHKLIWIKPYIKGNEENELIEKNYKVQY